MIRDESLHTLKPLSQSQATNDAVALLQAYIHEENFEEAKRLWPLLKINFSQFTSTQMLQVIEAAHRLVRWSLQLSKSTIESDIYYEDIVKSDYLNSVIAQINFYLRAGDTYYQVLQGKHLSWKVVFPLAVQAQHHYSLAWYYAERQQQKDSITFIRTRLTKFEGAMLAKLAPPVAVKALDEEEQKKIVILWSGRFHQAQQTGLEAFQKVVSTFYETAETFCHQEHYELMLQCYELIIKEVDDDQRYRKGKLQGFDTQELTRRMAKVHALKQQKTSGSVARWQVHYQRLHNLRQTYQANYQKMNQFTLQQQFTAGIRALLYEIAQECVELLREPPCPFSLLGKGSLSRGDMCPYSDADIALLIADAKHRTHPYFHQFLQLFIFKLMLLGESNEAFPGLHIDSTDQSALLAEGSEDINTPEGLAKHVNPANEEVVKDPKKYSLLRPVTLYASRGGEGLIKTYLDLLNTLWRQSVSKQAENNNVKPLFLYQSQALAFCQEDAERLQALIKRDNDEPTIDIKQRYLAPLTRWCYAMAIYHGWITLEDIEIAVILRKLEQKGCLHPAFFARLQQALITLQRLRIQSHLAVGYQMDTVLKPAVLEEKNAPWRRLTLTEFNALRTIDVLVLQPAYAGLPAIASPNWLSPVPFDPMANYIQQQLKQCLPVTEATELLSASKEAQQYPFEEMQQKLIETWVACQAPIEVYQAYYRRLPEIWRMPAFKAIMLAEQKAKLERRTALYRLLASYPNSDGTRLPCKEQQQNWNSTLKSILIENEESSTPQAFSSYRFFKSSKKDEPICIASRFTEIQRLPLSAEVSAKLFDDKGHLQKSNLPGRHKVFAATTAQGAVHCKIYPEFPGLEYAVSSLHALIAGYGAPLSELVKITAGKRCYPVLISQTIPGKPLHQVGKSLQDSLPSLEPKHFSQLVLVAMLINPEDGKPDNYILETFADPQTAETLYRLVGIDNDHAFMSSVLQERNGDEVKLLLQSKVILYCFDQMKQPLHPEAIEEFLALDPEKVLHQWLESLVSWEKNTHQLFTEEERKNLWQKHKEEKKCLLSLVLKEGLIKQLYQTFYQLQTILREQPQITAIELLLKIDPLLGAFIEKY